MDSLPFNPEVRADAEALRNLAHAARTVDLELLGWRAKAPARPRWQCGPGRGWRQNARRRGWLCWSSRTRWPGGDGGGPAMGRRRT
jgi:hypothetical protein